MLTILKWVIRILPFVLVFSFLHYTLPQRDIVRITDTEIIRKDFSGFTRIFYAQADSGDNETGNRDLRLLNTVLRNGNVFVYRNEDTGFGWPPYFKLDSSNLHAEAKDGVSTRDNPRWFILRHYGWRSEFLSIYPNAVSLEEIDDPNIRLIPWFNIIFLTVLFAVFWAIYVRIRRFWNNRIDPVFDDVEEGATSAWGWLTGFFNRK